MTAASNVTTTAFHYRVDYKSSAKWADLHTTAEFIRSKYASFDNGRDRDQYHKITDVNPNNIRELDRKRKFRRSLPTMRFTYFANERTLIVKLTNEAHHLISQDVNEILLRHCQNLGFTPPQFTVLGPSRQTLGNAIEKEQDESYKPDLKDRVYPSFVEVGASESVDQLHANAELWLSGTNGWTRGVLTVKIDKLARTLTFSRWRLLPRPSYGRTRSNAVLVPECAQTVTVDFDSPNGVFVTAGTTPLTIPVESICDAMARPNGRLNGESVISLSAQDLFDIGSEYFSV